MAGYSKIYCIGGLGGFLGDDGINPILVQIWVGNASRQWLEARYFDDGIHPIGKIKTLVPEGPDHPNTLLDACLAFFPKAFVNCPSLRAVEAKLADAGRLDFDQDRKAIPDEWEQLRDEAVESFRKLNIFEADLKPINQVASVRQK